MCNEQPNGSTNGIITEQVLESLHLQKQVIEELTTFVKGMALTLEGVRSAYVGIGASLGQLLEVCSQRPAHCAAIIASLKGNGSEKSAFGTASDESP